MSSGLYKRSDSRFHNDKELSINGAKQCIEIILGYSEHLLKVRKGGELLATIKSIKRCGSSLTDKQIGEVKRIYELMWKGFDIDKPEDKKLGSFTKTFKPSKKRGAGL